jgi:hypothetical protein
MKISTILDHIDSGHMAPPVFQRGYLWYRTKRLILEIFDAMQTAADTGVPYQTRLEPGPADPAVMHPRPQKE